MEEEKNQNGAKGKVCDCGCGYGWPSGGRLFRIVIAAIVVLIVFWVGVKVGEFKVLFGDYDYGGYQHFYRGYNMPVGPMMQGSFQGVPVPTATQ